MNLSIELTKNGKPHILHKNYKFRESYTLKSGDIIWRCLGRSCGATVKTDGNRVSVISSSNKHSGPHPTTMRSLTSQQCRLTSTPTMPARSSSPLLRLSPSPASLAPATSPLPATSATSPSPTASTTLAISPVSVTSPAPALTLAAVEPPASLVCQSELEAENNKLKLQIANLQEMYRCVLDHSVESDTRLLEFTDQVFVANTSRIDSPQRDVRVNPAEQCEMSVNDCQDPRCVDTQNLVLRLKTTIEVLETDNSCLRAEAKTRNCCGLNTEPWTVCLNKKNHAPIKTQNSYAILDSLPHSKDTGENKLKKTNNYKQNKKIKSRKKNILLTDLPEGNAKSKGHCHEKSHSEKSLNFHSILIEGDSHSRHLAGLVKQRVTASTRVSGICKPAAKLLEVTSGGLPPQGGCCIILAGTNDVAAGDSKNIYKFLEERIVARLASARVIVSTIPHRHDLPNDHQVNQQIVEVNNYIEELCTRHVGAQVLNINSIERRWFTRHGMHLRLPGKKILAELIVGSLMELSRFNFPKPLSLPSIYIPEPNIQPTSPSSSIFVPHSSTINPPSTLVSRPVSANSEPKQPILLPFETYADAVTGTLTQSKNETGRSPDRKNLIFKNCIEKG